MNVCAEPPAGDAAMAAELSAGLFPSRPSASRPFSAFPRFPLGGRGRVRGGRHTCEGQSRSHWPARAGAQRLGLCWILGHECDAAPVAEAPFLLPLSPPPGSGTISTVISPAGWSRLLAPRPFFLHQLSSLSPQSLQLLGSLFQFPRENLIGSAYLAQPPDWLLLGQVSTLSQSVLTDGASHMVYT